MARLGTLVALILVALALGTGSGLGRAGVIEIEGAMRLHIRPQAAAHLQGAPAGGVYSDGPFGGNEPLSMSFVVCCVEEPERGPFIFEWDFSYNGVLFNPEATGPGPVVYTYVDGPVNEVVALRLTDSFGKQSIIIEQVAVRNVVPVAHVGGPYAGLAGSLITFSGSATDAGPTDTAAGFTFEWDFDFNGTFAADQSGHNLTAPTYTYAGPGIYTAALRVTDKDGGVSTLSTANVIIGTTMSLSAVADTWVNEELSSNNYGTATTMDVTSRGSGGRNARSLVRFDLSSIPAGSTIVSATVSLYTSTVPCCTRTYQVRRVGGTWVETTVSWDSQPVALTTPTATAATPSSAGWMTWNVTADVQALVNGTATNNGWLVRDAVEDSQGYTGRFNTREHATTSLRPKLEIVYQPPS